MSTNKKQANESDVTLDGQMTYGKLENGRRIGDFQSTEHVALEPFNGKCRLQVMRNGNAYFTELKKRFRNKPLFKQDHSTMSLGKNKFYYFVLTMAEDEVEKLPTVLLQESKDAALKVATMIMEKGGHQ